MKESSNNPIKITTLLGKKNLSFSVYCLQSFITHCSDDTTLIIFDDGSLSVDEISYLEDNIPNCSVVSKTVRDHELEKFKPLFPLCFSFREKNVLAQKLIDVLLFNEQAAIFLDSDVLFFRKFKLPEFFMPTFIKDNQNAYIFHPMRVSRKLKTWPKINTGFFYFPDKGLQSITFLENLLGEKNISADLNRIPAWAEQSLWALLAGQFSEISYFDDLQIQMATANLKQTIPVAIHLVTTFREQFHFYKTQFINEEQYCSPLKLITAKKRLSINEYILERSVKKISRMVK